MSGAHKLICVAGSRGGTGTTVVAVNLAAALAASGKRTLLVDFSRRPFSAAAVMLGLKEPQTLAEIVRSGRDVTPENLGERVSPAAGGLSFLACAADHAGLRALVSPGLKEAVGKIARGFEAVVVDLALPVDSVAVDILEECHLLIVVVTPELISVRGGNDVVEAMRQLHFPREMTRMLCNRYAGGKAEDLLIGGLKRDLLASVPPAGKEIGEAVLKGRPLSITHPQSGIAKAFAELARVVAAAGAGIPGPRGADTPRRQNDEETAAFSLDELLGEVKRAKDHSDTRLDEIKMRVHRRLLEEIDLRKIDLGTLQGGTERSTETREKIRQKIVSILDEEDQTITSRNERERLAGEILDEALGLGPLEKILREKGVTEIMVNGKDRIYIERNGKLVRVPDRFVSDAQLLGVIERIVAPIGRRIDERTPMVDARLKDGSRVNAIIPPLALDGPVLTIRRFSERPYTAEDLVGFDSLSSGMLELLRAAVRSRQNILISGGTGSGKTTLLNALSGFIPEGERIITIEDSAELQLTQPHVCRLEGRPANIEGEGEISIRDLVKNALRMRPDRIVVGECRGGEALDMLQAMNTGHDGSLTTLHANNPRESFSRLEVLVMQAGFELPSRAIREQIAMAINLIIQVSRLSDGTRKVVNISEITGLEGDVIVMQDIFAFRQSTIEAGGAIRGKFVATGKVPKFTESLARQGIELSLEIFRPPRETPHA